MVARSIPTVTARERLDRLWLESTFVAWRWVMRTSDRSPSIVPPGNDQDVYLVLDDFGGRIGQTWRETNADATRLETGVAGFLTARIAIRFASLVSIRGRTGPGAASRARARGAAAEGPERAARF